MNLKEKNCFDCFSLLVPYPNNFLVVSLKMSVLFGNDKKSGKVGNVVCQ